MRYAGVNRSNMEAQIQQFGFNDTVGLVSFEQDGSIRPYSKRLHSVMDKEARQMIHSAYIITSLRTNIQISQSSSTLIHPA